MKIVEYKDLKVGDRVRCTALVTNFWRDSIPELEIELSEPMELLSQAKTPGQKTYEAWCTSDTVDGRQNIHLTWKYLKQEDQNRWEKVAEAARS